MFSLCLVFPFAVGVTTNTTTTSKIVSNEVELVNAINSDGAGSRVIVFNNDIRLMQSLVISVDKNITLTSNNNSGKVFFRLIGADGVSTITINDGGVLTLDGVIVTHNMNSMGRGVTVNSGGKLILSNGEVSGNNATMGGGVYVSYGTFNMVGGVIANNVASMGEQIDSSHVTEQHAGALHNAGGNGPNSVTGTGGGVYVGYDGSFSMLGGVVTNNTVDLDGGGVYVDAASSFSMSGDGVVANNSAARHGGGVYVNVGSFRIAGSARVVNNTATHRGGGVHMNFGSFSMSGGLINSNVAGTGGGVYSNLILH